MERILRLSFRLSDRPCGLLREVPELRAWPRHLVMRQGPAIPRQKGETDLGVDSIRAAGQSG
jgi:hypothetical protein